MPWVDTKWEDRLCQACHSSQDVQHLLFSCPAYSDVRQEYAILFQQAFSVSDLFTNSEPMHVVVFSESVFHVGNLLYPPDISLSASSCVVLCLLAPCWSPGH